jgi:hypothetical protein
MVDGDAIATSTKLNKVPEKYRLDFAYWLTFAEANGTFEVDASIIWAKYYAYQFPSRKLKHVSEIISAFSDTGLLNLWQDCGKTWGFFTKSKLSGRLPSPSQVKKYSNLPPDYPGPDQDRSRTGLEQVQGDLIRFDLNRNEQTRTETTDDSLLDSSSLQPSEMGDDMASTAKRYAVRLVEVWHEVHGPSAVVRMSGFDQARKDFEFFIETHDKGLIIEAFKLWAEEKGDPRNAYPLNKFLACAAEYMQRVQPLTALIEKEKKQADSQAASNERETQEIIKRRDFKPFINETSIDDLA